MYIDVKPTNSLYDMHLKLTWDFKWEQLKACLLNTNITLLPRTKQIYKGPQMTQVTKDAVFLSWKRMFNMKHKSAIPFTQCYFWLQPLWQHGMHSRPQAYRYKNRSSSADAELCVIHPMASLDDHFNPCRKISSIPDLFSDLIKTSHL